MLLSELVNSLRTLLNNELGVFSDTATRIKAIVVEPGDRPGNQIEGLLCVIQRTQLGKAEEVVSGKFLDYNWTIKLIQYDSKKSVDKAVQLIQQSPLFRVRSLVYFGPTTNNKEMAILTIADPSLIIY